MQRQFKKVIKNKFMKLKRLIVTGISAFIFLASVYTETDSGKSFPRIADFDPTNLYVEGNGGFTFPLFFTSQNLLPMTDYSYMFCTLKLRQVISRTSWHWLPYTLELVPGASVGINCITQIIGADYSTFYDTSIGGGFAHYGTAYIGIRTYPAGIFHRNKFNDYAKEDEKIRQRKLEEKMDKMEIKPDDWEGFVPPEKPDSLKQIEDPHSEETASELTPADRINDVAKAAITPSILTNFTPDADGYNDIEIFTSAIYNIYEEPKSWKI